MTDLLILGGTTEARLLCSEVHTLGLNAVVSLAGATTRPERMPIATRSGGFGGASGLRDWLASHHVRAVIDATHPFAAKMPWNAEAACRDCTLPRLRLIRPGFRRDPDWQSAITLETALAVIPSGRRVLLTTGRNDLGGIANRPDLRILLRSIEPVPDLPDHVEPILIRPPLNWDAEVAMLEGNAIDVLITKDSGGVTAPKLEAARALGIQVILIDRPPQPPGPQVETVAEAVAWLQGEVGFTP